MILGNDREAVIENIRYAAENRNFYAKVELSDPVLSDREKKAALPRLVSLQGAGAKSPPHFAMKTLT